MDEWQVAESPALDRMLLEMNWQELAEQAALSEMYRNGVLNPYRLPSPLPPSAT